MSATSTCWDILGIEVVVVTWFDSEGSWVDWDSEVAT